MLEKGFKWESVWLCFVRVCKGFVDVGFENCVDVLNKWYDCESVSCEWVSLVFFKVEVVLDVNLCLCLGLVISLLIMVWIILMLLFKRLLIV